MTTKYRFGLSLVAATLFAALLPLHAAANDRVAPGLYNLIMWSKPDQPAKRVCLIQGNNGVGGPVGHSWSHSNWLTCGWSNQTSWTQTDFVNNGQALYRVIDTGLTTGTNERGYILQNKRSGQCLQVSGGRVVFSGARCDVGNAAAVWLLDYNPGNGTPFGPANYTPLRPLQYPMHCLIYSNNGHDRVPSLYRWGNAPGDSKWCGLGSQQALQGTGQGWFLMLKYAN